MSEFSTDVEDVIKIIREDLHTYGFLHDKFVSIINRDPILKSLVHSYKSRFKDIEHLKDKILRKNIEDLNLSSDQQKGPINTVNVKKRITDICGIRILHLHMGQFPEIHKSIMSHINSGDLYLFEQPKAYTWDPEYSKLFQSLGIESKQKDSFYTSVHYVLKARQDSDVTCEVQVRTLFEEVWGEIDHNFNYPSPTESIVVQEQLKVLARMVGAGTRLAHSIYMLESERTQLKSGA